MTYDKTTVYTAERLAEHRGWEGFYIACSPSGGSRFTAIERTPRGAIAATREDGTRCNLPSDKMLCLEAIPPAAFLDRTQPDVAAFLDEAGV